LYSDDENSKTDKLSRKMHSIVTRKGNKQYLGIATKIKHLKESINVSDDFTFSPKEKDDNNDWEKLDNEQEFIQNKRDKKDDDDKDPGGSGFLKILQ
jgi:hypothetical protein